MKFLFFDVLYILLYRYGQRVLAINNRIQFWPMRRRQQQPLDIFDNDLDFDWNDRIENRLRLRHVNVINERNIINPEIPPPPYEY